MSHSHNHLLALRLFLKVLSVHSAPIAPLLHFEHQTADLDGTVVEDSKFVLIEFGGRPAVAHM